MYDYTHCVSDALENITHSICTLEFEDQRPFYDWVLERIVPVLRAPQFIHAMDLVRGLRDGDVDAQEAFARRCRAFEHKLFGQRRGARDARDCSIAGPPRAPCRATSIRSSTCCCTAPSSSRRC